MIRDTIKKTAIAGFVFTVLISCQHRADTIPAGKLKKVFNPFLNGAWVKTEYIHDITKTKSPHKSSKTLNGIVSFIIDTATIRGDSMFLSSSIGNHEGMNFLLYFKQGEQPNSLLTNIHDDANPANSFELGYLVNSNDTSLILYHYDENKKLIAKKEFTKVLRNQSNDVITYGLQYIVNKKLISGTYKTRDLTGGETTLQFTDKGKVTGFAGFKTYYVLTDFFAEPGASPDRICFDIETDTGKWYEFEIKDNILYLFEAQENNPGKSRQRNSPTYKLIKQ
ncbi:MAG: hypothetical protein WDO71_26315 [Bacteroidota bacterium]